MAEPRERPILFSGPMVRAILEGRKTRRKLYVRHGEDPQNPQHLARRLANGLDSAPDDGCWDWRRSARNSGHRTMTIGGRTVSVYRVAFALGVAPIPVGKWVLHRCDNPRCINPAHLELGDQAKNMADCARRGRTAAGEANGRAKLTARQADRARRLVAMGRTRAEIARQFGVAASTIGRLARGESWTKRVP